MHRREGRRLQAPTDENLASSGARAPLDIGMLSSGRSRLARSIALLSTVCTCAVALSLAATASPAYAAPEAPETTEATEVTAGSARLNGVLNPNAVGEPGTFHFTYSPSPTTCEESQLTTPIANDLGTKREAAAATAENLLPATKYTFCLVAANAEGFEQVFGPARTFSTPAGPPTVSQQAVVTVGAATATVSARIGPGGLVGTYYAEFVSEPQFKAHGWAEAVRAPAVGEELPELPAASAPVLVSENLQNLQPNSAYRFRFVASNVLGSATGTAEPLTTASSGSGAALPDNRVAEWVSMSGNFGEPYLPPTPVGVGPASPGFRSVLPFRAAGDGHAVTYVAEPGVSSGSGETGPGEGNQWLAVRTPTGWRPEDITPSENVGATYQWFSNEFANGVYEGNATPLTADVQPGCASLYLRNSASASFKALFTSGAAPTPAKCGRPLFAGATSDESQIIFQSEAALTAGSEEATSADVPPGHNKAHHPIPNTGEGCMFGCNLYESVGGRLQLVNVLEGKSVPSATFGGYSPGEEELTNFSHAISSDGSRIFWTDTQAGPGMEHVFVLKDKTTQVPVSGSGPAEYWTATPDGHYAFYTEAGRLWQFDTQKAENSRTALTEANSEVQGVLGASEDGEYVYFVANGVLAGASTTPGECSVKEGAGCNLYVLHHNVTTFIAKLPWEDSAIHSDSEGLHQTSNDWRANLGERLAQVTPDGRHLVFQSVAKLAGYSSGSLNPEPAVFVYTTDQAKLSCVSCSPTGALPSIEEESLRSKLPVSAPADTYLRRWISDNGSRVFFDTSQPLVPQDRNGVQDVYEWERPAIPGESNNSCTAAEASPVTGGCTYLLSGGTSKVDSFLVDADSTGENVFFEHLGPLGQVPAPVDHNQLYDTRVGGGFPQLSLGCAVGACDAAVQPPTTPTPPASLVFSGVGNFAAVIAKPLTRSQKLSLALKACRRIKKASKRHSCQRRARSRYGPPKAKRARIGAKRATHHQGRRS